MHATYNARTSTSVKVPSTSGLWWRFSSYKIERGGIVPTAGAELSWYDPWDAFRDSRGLTIGQAPNQTQPIYGSLMTLVASLEFNPGVRRFPDCVTPESQQLILEMVSAIWPTGNPAVPVGGPQARSPM
jgi:hypothetical protein